MFSSTAIVCVADLSVKGRGGRVSDGRRDGVREGEGREREEGGGERGKRGRERERGWEREGERDWVRENYVMYN